MILLKHKSKCQSFSIQLQLDGKPDDTSYTAKHFLRKTESQRSPEHLKQLETCFKKPWDPKLIWKDVIYTLRRCVCWAFYHSSYSEDLSLQITSFLNGFEMWRLRWHQTSVVLVRCSFQFCFESLFKTGTAFGSRNVLWTDFSFLGEMLL